MKAIVARSGNKKVSIQFDETTPDAKMYAMEALAHAYYPLEDVEIIKVKEEV